MSRNLEMNIEIASSGTTSAIRQVEGTRDNHLLALVGLIIPATIDSTTLTIKSSVDGSTPLSIYDAYGSAIGSAIPIAAGRHIILDPADYCGLEYFQIVMGSTEAAARTIKVLARYV